MWKIPNVKVLKIEEHKRRVYVDGIGDKTEFREEPLGYFAQFEGSYESLFLGYEKPNLQPGDTVDITITRNERSLT